MRVFVLMVSMLLIIILPCVVRANNYSSYVKRNMFYVQVLNYTMPAVKATSFNEDDMAENRFSISQTALAATGLNLKNPKSVLGREMAFIGSEDIAAGERPNVDFNHFKLDDKQVAKETDNTVANSNENTNLQNREVAVHDPKLKKTLNTDKPEVFIYHTHTTEGYKPGKPINTDNTQNVVAVGDELIKELQTNYGISAINDKTVHDAEAYTQSYARSAVTVDRNLNKYKDFKLIIDLHRDSVENKNAVTTKVNGENAAKISLVMAKKNPHFSKNMALANEIIDTSNKLFPGFCRGVIYYNYGTRYFNQNKSDNAILIEVGADINTIDEAKASAKYLARIIAEVLNK